MQFGRGAVKQIAHEDGLALNLASLRGITGVVSPCYLELRYIFFVDLGQCRIPRTIFRPAIVGPVRIVYFLGFLATGECK